MIKLQVSLDGIDWKNIDLTPVKKAAKSIERLAGILSALNGVSGAIVSGYLRAAMDHPFRFRRSLKDRRGPGHLLPLEMIYPHEDKIKALSFVGGVLQSWCQNDCNECTGVDEYNEQLGLNKENVINLTADTFLSFYNIEEGVRNYDRQRTRTL